MWLGCRWIGKGNPLPIIYWDQQNNNNNNNNKINIQAKLGGFVKRGMYHFVKITCDKI